MTCHGAKNRACGQPIRWRVVHAGRLYLCCEKHLGGLATKLLGNHRGSFDFTPIDAPSEVPHV